MSEWRPDPFGRYEQRLFVDGEPTEVVHHAGTELRDPFGAAAPPDFAGAPPEENPAPHRAPTRRPARKRFVIAVLAALIVVGLGVGGALWWTASRADPDAAFLNKVAEIARVSNHAASLHRQRLSLLGERKAVCGATNDQTLSILAGSTDTLDHSTALDHQVLAAGYRAAVSVSCPSKRSAFDKALEAAESARAARARAGASQDPTTLLNDALRAQIAGDIAQAQHDYQKVIKLDPRNKFAYYDLALTYDTQGRTPEAEHQYQLALAIDPKYNPALYNLARLRATDGDTTGAISLYRRAITSNPHDAKAHYNLGLLLRAVGQTAAGNAEVQQAVKLDPSLAAGAAAQGVPSSG